ncbi:MAG: hypothetical protein ACLFRV_05395 [Acidimicrobiales bacterium]
MSTWLAVAMVVVAIGLAALVASVRLVADAVRDLTGELARLTALGTEARRLRHDLHLLGAHRGRGHTRAR